MDRSPTAWSAISHRGRILAVSRSARAPAGPTPMLTAVVGTSDTNRWTPGFRSSRRCTPRSWAISAATSCARSSTQPAVPADDRAGPTPVLSVIGEIARPLVPGDPGRQRAFVAAGADRADRSTSPTTTFARWSAWSPIVPPDRRAAVELPTRADGSVAVTSSMSWRDLRGGGQRPAHRHIFQVVLPSASTSPPRPNRSASTGRCARST